MARQEADALARRIRFDLGREIRNARLDGATSLRDAAARVGISHSQLGRIERGQVRRLTVDQLSRACAAVGLALAVRGHPGSGAALDAAQLALLGRLRAQLPLGVAVRTEVPLPIPGDRRAWDTVLELDPNPTPVEAETRLRDIQALDRRVALKLRDSEFDLVLLLVNDTAHNRALLELHREDLRTSLPLDSRSILRALRKGRTPEASGIVVL
jgi:transcriptional regulator with XRE-family HTH domain